VLSNGKGTIFLGLTECMISRGGLREVERIHPQEVWVIGEGSTQSLSGLDHFVDKIPVSRTRP